MLPDLLRLVPGRDRRPSSRTDDAAPFRPTDEMDEILLVSRWAELLGETGANMDHVVEEDLPANIPEEELLAQDAWQLAERLKLVWDGRRTRTGDRLASIARRPWDEREMADHRTVVRTVAQSVRENYVGGDGLEVVPFLQEAAQVLADTDHVWARHCPGLLLVEFDALIYWAFESPAHAIRLRDDLVIYRDVAMHRYRMPPPADGDPDDIQIVHEDETIRLYSETEELGARTDLTLTEVRSTAGLLVFAELLEQPLWTAATYLSPPQDGGDDA